MTTEKSDKKATVGEALVTIDGELHALVGTLMKGDTGTGADARESLDTLAELIEQSDRVFVHGAGRSGLALRMTAMRLMHLGRVVHVVGEVTTPAIGEGDLLLTASGSGATGEIVRAAETAVKAGARVAVITTVADSPLAELAAVAVVVPAATKQDRSGTASVQYAGGLFEQAVVLLGDALFHALWKRSGASGDELWPRHANIE